MEQQRESLRSLINSLLGPGFVNEAELDYLMDSGFTGEQPLRWIKDEDLVHLSVRTATRRAVFSFSNNSVVSKADLARLEDKIDKQTSSAGDVITTISALPAIEEGRELALLSTGASRIEDYIDSRFQELTMLIAHKGVAVGDSATTLGENVLRFATNEELVEVTQAARDVAESWLVRAGAEGIAMRQAMEPKSDLQENGSGGVQDIFSKLLPTQPTGLQIQMHDVHSITSVCRALKPDMICSVSDVLIPSSTVLIVELKRQNGAYNNAAHIHQLCTYGTMLLDQLPATTRSSVLLCVTDLRRIQFIRMTRTAGSSMRYALSPEMADVLPALCAVMQAPPQKYGASPPPQLRYKGMAVDIKRFLGAGATSSVLEVLLTVADGRNQGKEMAAAKLPSEPHSVDHECNVLEALATDNCPGIPHLVGPLDDGKGMLVQPSGTPFDIDMLLQNPRLFEVIGQPVDTLEAAHKLGWVHGDIRLDNLLTLGKPAHTLFIIDWGCARQQFPAPVSVPTAEYAGTVKFASNAVLVALEDGTVKVTPSDDLQSLVKSMFALRHGGEVQALGSVSRTSFADIRRLWDEWLQGRPTWSSVMAAAAETDYGAVKQGLARCLE